MAPVADHALLDALLDAWDRHQAALRNLLRALPEGGLAARATSTGPTVAQMFTHLHHERMISVEENAPEYAGALPAREWEDERDPERIERWLDDSAARVRAAVRNRTEEGRALDRDFAHPVHLLAFLIFHEGYHHGQIKLALKIAGTPLEDAVAGPLVWGLWRARRS